jgi:hypothetical protein
MASNQQKTPSPQLPPPEIAQSGTVRVGGGVITGKLPDLQRPTPKIAGRGTVRVGGGVISGNFPL